MNRAIAAQTGIAASLSVLSHTRDSGEAATVLRALEKITNGEYALL